MANFRESNTKWRFEKDLGSGAFGNVSLWISSETKDAVVIKRCHVDFDKLGLDEKQKQELRWKLENDLMSRIIDKHPNIVSACHEQCRDLIEEQNLMSKIPNKISLTVIAMEYCDGGNLRQKLEQINNVNGFSEYDVREVLKALSGAISHLHNFKVTHRDIKPDNIVIKLDGNMKPIYKLTDMGYARHLDYKTINASMVGTVNYFAPEIAVTANYKNNVDYWSIGIVAFEIMCGVLPFLQDESMCVVLNNILKKSDKCIAITKTNNGHVIHHEKLFENRLSVAFRSLIEPWLQLALEKDAQKRGYEAGQLTFYKKLESALNAKIITVFWINRCEYLSYVVDETMTMDSLLSKMEKNTGVERTKYYFAFPERHTLDLVSVNVKPIQLYEEKLAAEDRPMLYLVDFKSISLCNQGNDPLSDSIRQYLNMEEPLKKWILKDFLRNVLHIHHKELRKIREFVNGIRDYAMNLEHEMMNQELYIKDIKDKDNYFKGQVAQYERMVATGKQLFQEKQIPIDVFISTECETITQNFDIQLKSVLKKIRDFLEKCSLDQYLEDFVLHVKQFEIHCYTNFQLMSVDDLKTQTFSLVKERHNFFTKAGRLLEDSITSFHLEFVKIMGDIKNHNQVRNEWQIKLEQRTKNYMKEFAETYNSSIYRRTEDIVERMDFLHIDNGAVLENVSYNLDDDGMNETTERVLNDAQTLMQVLKSTFLP